MYVDWIIYIVVCELSFYLWISKWWYGMRCELFIEKWWIESECWWIALKLIELWVVVENDVNMVYVELKIGILIYVDD